MMLLIKKHQFSYILLMDTVYGTERGTDMLIMIKLPIQEISIVKSFIQL